MRDHWLLIHDEHRSMRIWAWTWIGSWLNPRLGDAEPDSGGIAQRGGNLAHVPGSTTVSSRRNQARAMGVFSDDLIGVRSVPSVQARSSAGP